MAGFFLSDRVLGAMAAMNQAEQLQFLDSLIRDYYHHTEPKEDSLPRVFYNRFASIDSRVFFDSLEEDMDAITTTEEDE